MPSDREILMELFNCCNGEKWSKKWGWGSTKPLRQWYGVTTNSLGQVTELVLLFNNLSGCLPASIGDLQYLQSLRLGWNINLIGGYEHLVNLSNLLDLGIDGRLEEHLGLQGFPKNERRDSISTRSTSMRMLSAINADLSTNSGNDNVSPVARAHGGTVTATIANNRGEVYGVRTGSGGMPLQQLFGLYMEQTVNRLAEQKKTPSRKDLSSWMRNGYFANSLQAMLGLLRTLDSDFLYQSNQSQNDDQGDLTGTGGSGEKGGPEPTTGAAAAQVPATSALSLETAATSGAPVAGEGRRRGKSQATAVTAGTITFPDQTNPPLAFDSDAGFVWLTILTHSALQEELVPAVATLLDKHIENIKLFADMRDDSGRRAVDVALPKFKRLIEERMLFLKRFELVEGAAEHMSATSQVVLAKDYAPEAGGAVVALKFMSSLAQYDSEVRARLRHAFDSQFLVSMTTHYSSDEDTFYATEATKKGFFRYCIVMPAAERNLARVLAHEHIAGRDWAQIRLMTLQIAEALNHLHSKNVVHADIKPLNIMRQDSRFKIIDLDAALQRVEGQYCGEKFSSAFIPPEMVALVNKKAVVRRFERDEAGIPMVSCLPYSLVPANNAVDIWAVGVTLYHLFTGEPLFLMDEEGNMDEHQLLVLQRWTTAHKNARLSKVRDRQARNLLSRLLNKDPASRPDTAHILQHPFITGRQPVRMVGEQAEYDVFLSYREAADSKHAEALYTALTSRNLTVFWDKKCLEAGKSWEEGFCDGLVKTRVFVCLLSRAAIRHPEIERQNFEKLHRASSCDNVFLEHRMALELAAMGLLARIFPVFIGEETAQDTYSSYHDWGDWAATEVVDAVESKLRLHLDRQGLGAPLEPSATPQVTTRALFGKQGCKLEGSGTAAMQRICDTVTKMVHEERERESAADYELGIAAGGATHGGMSRQDSLMALSSDASFVQLSESYLALVEGFHRISHQLAETQTLIRTDTAASRSASRSLLNPHTPPTHTSHAGEVDLALSSTGASSDETTGGSNVHQVITALLQTLEDSRRRLQELDQRFQTNHHVHESLYFHPDIGDRTSLHSAWARSLLWYCEGQSVSLGTQGADGVGDVESRVLLSFDPLSSHILWRAWPLSGSSEHPIFHSRLVNCVESTDGLSAWYTVHISSLQNKRLIITANDSRQQGKEHVTHVVSVATEDRKEVLTLGFTDEDDRNLWLSLLQLMSRGSHLPLTLSSNALPQFASPTSLSVTESTSTVSRDKAPIQSNKNQRDPAAPDKKQDTVSHREFGQSEPKKPKRRTREDVAKGGGSGSSSMARSQSGPEISSVSPHSSSPVHASPLVQTEAVSWRGWDPIFRGLVRRIVSQKPRDVITFAIEDLQQLQRLSAATEAGRPQRAKLAPIVRKEHRPDGL